MLLGGKQCGDEFPKDVYITEGRELTVTFHSNETLQDSGFEVIITPFHTSTCIVAVVHSDCNRVLRHSVYVILNVFTCSPISTLNGSKVRQVHGVARES